MLKESVKLLEDRYGVATQISGDDAPIKGRNLDEGEVAAERISDDSEEMATVLTSMDAATVLASGVVHVPTGSGYIPTASTPAAVEVPTGSDVVPTASLVFATATVVTPYLRRKFKEVMSQQRKLWTKKQKRDYYMAVIRSNLGWKVKDFGGMMFEEVKAKFNSVWKQMEDFIPIGSKEKAERIKRKGLSLEQESAKKQKTSEEVSEEAKSSNEVLEEKVKEMMQLVSIEEVYVEALQVKHPIIDWKHLDKEDLNQLWRLVKETLSNRPPTSDKEMELWGRIVGNKMQKAFPLPGIEFPLAEEVPNASEEGCHCQKKREATTRKIALLSKSRRNCQSNSNDSFTKPKLYVVTPLPKSKGIPKIDESHALSKPVTSNSVPTPTESKVVKNDNVISPGIFRINPFKASRIDNFVPNKRVKPTVRTKPITVSQPHVITKNDKVPFKSKSRWLLNKLEQIEENDRNLQFICSTNYSNGENQVDSKLFAVTTADAFDTRQQQQDSTSSTSTLATTITANGNFDL
uniref:Uncharacterized protein n=1 Tax=Tanacetum cinerariifolium TaxID=118510 RepID=A0A6L2NXY6_TANCI|nr:hypothetical protein [Tanacetum cinerariifolium]